VRHHHHRLGVPGKLSGPFERGQRRLRLAYPAQFHQGDEPPEHAAPLLGVITRGAGQIDDLRRGGQPVPGRRGVPQRMQPGIKHSGQHRWLPGGPGQGEGLIGQGPPAGRGAWLGEQLPG
jgi:hypothetical protein